MAQACLGTLLRLDKDTGKGGSKEFPLVEYAAQCLVEHARLENVSSRVQGGLDNLFDTSRPHFAAWLRAYDMDLEPWYNFSLFPQQQHYVPPLYYAAVCGLYDLAERLIAKHPEQVNAVGGRILAPLPAALRKKHFRVANLLHSHGAVVDVRGDRGRTPLYSASRDGLVDIIRWLPNHGAAVSVPRDDGWTPLHGAAGCMRGEAVRLLLDHNADVNSRNQTGRTPLCETIFDRVSSQEGRAVDVVRRMLEHGADPNASCDHNRSTLLHEALHHGWLEVAQLLLSHGAKADGKNEEGKTPFQVASEKGYHEFAKLLSERVVVTQP